MIKLGYISHEIHVWIQQNASSLNIDFHFKLLNDKNHITTPKLSQLDLVMDLLFLNVFFFFNIK